MEFTGSKGSVTLLSHPHQFQQHLGFHIGSPVQVLTRSNKITAQSGIDIGLFVMYYNMSVLQGGCN